jgi:hypothetical protein
MSKRPQSKAARVARDSRTGAPSPAGGSDQSAPSRSPGVGLEVQPRPQSQWSDGAREPDQPVERSAGDESGYQG